MAYCDYGAFVYKNGERYLDKEDAYTFEHYKELNWPYETREFHKMMHHGIMGDGNIRVECHKQGAPTIVEKNGKTVTDIHYTVEDPYDHEPIDFEYKGYKFHFESGRPYVARMIEPDGTLWECEYDYFYGAGFGDWNDE